MKITREKLIAIWGLINRLVGEKTTVKFHYLLLKNKRIIEPEVESLQKANQPPENFQEFEEKRLELCGAFSEKDEKDTPVLENGNFKIAEETKDQFQEALAELKEEFSNVIETMDSNQKEFMELLKEEVEIEFAQIPLSIINGELIGRDVDLLYDIILEDC